MYLEREAQLGLDFTDLQEISFLCFSTQDLQSIF